MRSGLTDDHLHAVLRSATMKLDIDITELARKAQPHSSHWGLAQRRSVDTGP